MKKSLKKKWLGFAAARHEREELKHQQSLVFVELDQASQDMVDLRDCYDKLFSVAAETANNVYGFSESLGEMGDCLLEKTALIDDEESGKSKFYCASVSFYDLCIHNYYTLIR
ncbi:uncharacterized protein At2g33490-like [Olea europaea var. sylvestris]|uniref:uncharacterized protein At2g33490-like n=1 Tax=Olea europaea var. sylvestris TaxID=158386 RepID=UPI000C1CD464|nr:uncharacterized protein At2g33490-like [Olea europaea var. sylvestris]